MKNKIFKHLYFKKLNTEPVNQAKIELLSIYETLSAGINWNASHDNGKAIVEYVYKCMDDNEIIHYDQAITHHYIRCLREIIAKLESVSADTTYIRAFLPDNELPLTDISGSYELHHCQKYIYRYILDYWNILGNFTFTFRLLKDMATMQVNWDYLNGNLEELKTIITKVKIEWGINNEEI